MDGAARHSALVDIVNEKLACNRLRVRIDASSFTQSLVSLPTNAVKSKSSCCDQATQIFDSSKAKLEEKVIDLYSELLSVNDDRCKLRSALEDSENCIFEMRESAAIALDEEMNKFKDASNAQKKRYEEEISSLRKEIDRYRKAQIAILILPNRGYFPGMPSQDESQNFLDATLSARTTAGLATLTHTKKKNVEIGSALNKINELLKEIENHKQDPEAIEKESAMIFAIEEKDRIIEAMTGAMRKIELELEQRIELAAETNSKHEKTIENLTNDFNRLEGEKVSREKEIIGLTKKIKEIDEQMKTLKKINIEHQENLVRMRETEELNKKSRTEMRNSASNTEEDPLLNQEIDSLNKIIISLRDEIEKHPDILDKAVADHAREIQQLTEMYEDKLKDLKALEENKKLDRGDHDGSLDSKEEEDKDVSEANWKDEHLKEIEQLEVEIGKIMKDRDESAARFQQKFDEMIEEGKIVIEDNQNEDVIRELFGGIIRNDESLIADHKGVESGSPNLVKMHKKEINEYKKLLFESTRKCEKLQNTVKDYQDLKDTLEDYITDLERKYESGCVKCSKREDKFLERGADIIDSLITKLHTNSQVIDLNDISRLHAEVIIVIKKFLMRNPEVNVSLKPAIETSDTPPTAAERRRLLLSLEDVVRQLMAEETSMKIKVKDLNQKALNLQRSIDFSNKNTRTATSSQRTSHRSSVSMGVAKQRLPRNPRNGLDGGWKP